MRKGLEIPRVPILILGGVSLISAILGGLIRIGWGLPLEQPNLVISHGPLMVCGFLGTVISLERAVATGKNWFFLGPLCSGLCGIMLIIHTESNLAKALALLSSIILVSIFISFLKIQKADFIVVMTLGAISWLIGILFWINVKIVVMFVWWWIGFLLLTIAGERLELGRLLMHSNKTKNLLYTALAIFICGMLLTPFKLDPGIKLLGFGMLLISIWLFRFDMARKTIKQTGLPKFIAANLLIGYFWLALSGLLAMLWGDQLHGGRYDIILHTFFLGFVFSMIFGHAPVILPAVLRVNITFQNRLYLPVVLLHLSILIRVAGDYSQQFFYLRQWGGMLNGITLAIFILNTATLVKKQVEP